MILLISAFVQAQTSELNIRTEPTVKATCGQCNGRAALNVGDSEINKGYDKKEIKITLKNKQGEFSVSSTFGEKSRYYYFDKICEGDYTVILERIDSRFTGLACAKKEYPGKMTAEGEGNFTVDLVSISNELIQVSSTAKNPTYKWSNGAPGNFVQAQANTSYFVTVTDEVGCTKVGGPYKLPDGCGEGPQYNFEPSVAGPKMYTTPGKVLRAQVKPNGSTNFVDADASYTITWKDPAGNVLGTGTTLPATFNLYKNFDFLTLEFANKCKKLSYQFNLLKCGSASPELSTLFKVQSQPSCAELDTKDINGNPIDLKSGSLSLNLAALGIPASNISIKVDGTTYDDQSSITVNNLGAGPHQVEVSIVGATPQDKCTYILNPSVGEAAFQVVSAPATQDGDCAFNLYCPTNKARPTFIVPAAREYTIEITKGETKSVKERNTMCRPMLDCVLGDKTFPVRDPRRSRVTAITSWAGILDEVFNALLKDENSDLTPEQKAELRRLCEANAKRDKCAEVVFCPGSLTVIDDTRAKNGRRENGDNINSETNCRALDCGKDGNRAVHSTCDPEIAAIVDIDMPVGKDGTSICKEAPKPPDSRECDNPITITVEHLIDEYVKPQGFAFNGDPKFPESPLFQLASKIVNERWDQSMFQCREFKYCPGTFFFKGEDLINMEEELSSVEYCRPCGVTTTIHKFNEALGNPQLKALIKLVYDRTNRGLSGKQLVVSNEFNCTFVEYCPGENRLVNVERLRRHIDNPPACSDFIDCGEWAVERLNNLVIKFNADQFNGVQGFAGSELHELLIEAKNRHKNATNPRCLPIQYCTRSFQVYDLDKAKKFASNKSCPAGNGANFHSDEEHSHEESAVSFFETMQQGKLLGEVEDLVQPELRVKTYLDSIPTESFLRFAPLISGGGIVPKAITTSAQGNYYYNYSHVDNNLALFADSTLQYEWNSWDANKTFTVYESVAKREYVLTYSGPERAWSAPLESDTLLRITHYSVRDSFLYLGGYVSGALRYRGELLNPDYTHERLDGFMMRIGTSGTFRGMNILQHIDTLDGLRFAQGSSGDLLVAGRVLGDTLQINDQKISLNSSDLGFVAAIQSNDLAFNILKTLDLNGATISKFAASANAQSYALVLSNFDTLLSNGSVQEGNALGLLVYSTSGNLSWFDKFKGNLDPQQLDVAFDPQSGLSLGITYTGIVQHANDAVFLYSQGKEDIGLIKYDSTGALTWKKSYGGPETETIKAMLYDDGVIYFGGNLKGQSYYRQLGGYGFYNTTGAFDRAYVSYVLDSVPSAPTAELLQLGKPNVSNTPSLKNLSKALTIYPNPFSNEVMTEFELELASSVQIVVQNELGNTVQSAVVQGLIGLNRHQLSTQLLPPGIYIIQVVNAERRVIGVGKVVKVKP
jgi:hypothetical protein